MATPYLSSRAVGHSTQSWKRTYVWLLTIYMLIIHKINALKHVIYMLPKLCYVQPNHTNIRRMDIPSQLCNGANLPKSN